MVFEISLPQLQSGQAGSPSPPMDNIRWKKSHLPHPTIHIMLLIFIGIIGNKSVKFTPDVGNQFPPFCFPAFCHNHFTACNMHFHAHFFCQSRIMKLKFGIRFKPVAPLRFTDYVFVKKLTWARQVPFLQFTVGFNATHIPSSFA